LALVLVSRVVAGRVATVVDDDVADEQGGSGRGRRGWGACWGAIGRPGSVCRRFDRTGHRSWGELARSFNIVDCDMAVAGGSGCITRDWGASCGELSVCVDVSLVLVVVWVLMSMVVGTASVWVLELFRVVSSASFDAMAFATSVTSIKCPSSTETQWPYPCSVIQMPLSFVLPFSSLFSTSCACHCVETQIPGPCPSASHFRRSSSFPFCVPSSYPPSRLFSHSFLPSSTPFSFPIL
jgi:hypothetical protein